MTDKTGGLVGAAGATARAAKAAASVLPSANKFALWLVFAAGAMTVLKKAGVEIPDYAIYFGCALGIAALLYEKTSAADMIEGWYRARPGAMTAAALVWACAFGFSVNNWLGAASESQAEKSNIHLSSFNAYQLAQNELKAAQAEDARIQARLAWMDTAVNGRPVRTADAAQSDIDAAKAQKLWLATGSCSDLVGMGKKAKDFCAGYRSAEAEKSLAMEKATLEEERKLAADRLRKAQEVAASTKVEKSEGRKDLVLYQKAGLSQDDAELVNGLIAIIAVSIFLSFGSMRARYEELAAEGPRTPFHWGTRVRRWLSKTLYGREPGDVVVIKEAATPSLEPTLSLRDRLALKAA